MAANLARHESLHQQRFKKDSASMCKWETDFYPVRVLGGDCARPMRLPDPSPVLDKNRAPMGSEILSSTGAGVWRKAPMAFPDSSPALDKFQSECKCKLWGFDGDILSEKETKMHVTLWLQGYV